MKRREFLKLSAATCAALASMEMEKKGLFRPLLAQAAESPGLPGSLGAKETTSVCEMCFWRCPIVGKVKNGRLVKIEGNPKSPTNGPRVCAKGNAGVQLLYDPDRTKYPMKRVGARGEGKWARISWDEALDEIAYNIQKTQKKYGPHSVACFDHGASAEFYREIYKALGTENYSNEPAFFQCLGAVTLAYAVTYGYQIRERVDMPNAKVMLFFGTHLGENIHVAHTRNYIHGLENGAKLIVVDPRFSAPAGKADMWLAIRPGTDVALLLAWINYLIQNNLYDKDFVENNCYGFDKLKESVKGYKMEWAAKICDLDVNDMKKAIELLAANKPHVTVHPGRHSAWYGKTDVQRHRAMAILNALLGAVGVKGGMFFPTPIHLKRKPECLECKNKHKVKPPETSLRDDYPFAYFFPGTPTDAIISTTISGDPYPIKLWGVSGVNLMQTISDPYKTMKAIENLDFIYTVEILPTESAIWADIVLPEANYLERYDTVFTKHDLKPYVTLRQPIVEPMFEAKPPFWIAKQLAKRLGLDMYGCQDEKDYLNEMLSGVNLSIDKLNKEGGLVTFKANPYRDTEEGLDLNTDSGSVQLYMDSFEDADMDPIPKYEPILAPPKGYARMVYGRVPMHTFSRTMNNLWLHNEYPKNMVWVNDEVAKKIGLKEGDIVTLQNQDGYKSIPVAVKVTPGIRPDTVYLPHGFGSRSMKLTKAYMQGASDQFMITRFFDDPFMGGSGHRTNFVHFIKEGKTLEIPELRPLPPEIPRYKM